MGPGHTIIIIMGLVMAAIFVTGWREASHQHHMEEIYAENRCSNE